MSLKDLPGAPTGRPSASVRSEILPNAFARWSPGLRAEEKQDEAGRTIGIYDVIGVDYWTGEGVTSRHVAAALRQLGPGDVTVNVNSPGGDMFEGLAIYNMLREHKGQVTVKVLGLAASAASVIAMAGDVVQVPRAGFLMIHNAWVVAAGNRNDYAELAAWLKPFDAAMADIYAARTGRGAEAMGKLMDADTWINGASAVEQGFADELLASDQVGSDEAKAQAHAPRRLEAALRAGGMPKSEALRLLSQFQAGAGNPAGSGGGMPAERGPVADMSATAAAAASLTSILN